jgi:hypothetical protein
VRDVTLVAVASAGHSGSTLLDVLLGNHSQVCSAGEMNRLTLHAPDRVCACGATVTVCDYWNRVRAVITRERRQASRIRWDECHTDLPPQQPMLRLSGVLGEPLVDGEAIPFELRARLAAAGVSVGEGATVTRRGVRDFKWRLKDPATNRLLILRNGEECLEVYDPEVRWKKPLRIVPEPLEVSLALGTASAVSMVRALSPRAASYAQIAGNSWTVADAMAEVSNARYVIDSSKSPVRLKLLYMLRPERMRILHLVRDGRAVAASAIRRHDNMSASMAARIWKRDNQNLRMMLRTVPDRRKLGVRYEALCEDPAAELRRVCEFLELEFDPAMLTLWSRPVHNIPGNPMLFNRSQRAIRKDERWRRDLSENDIQAFERAAGRLNRAFGYI